MLEQLNEAIEEKGKKIQRLHEELEICKLVTEDKMTEVIQLLDELAALQELSPAGR